MKVTTRHGDYGLTESRYMGYLLIAFEIIFIALMIIVAIIGLLEIIIPFAIFHCFHLLQILRFWKRPQTFQTAHAYSLLYQLFYLE